MPGPKNTPAFDPLVSDSRADGGGVFAVKVESTVAFVTSPMAAFEAIYRETVSGDDISADDPALNEGIHYWFDYGGIRHDVTLTREDA